MEFMNPDFDAYQLSEEHEALREAVRDLATKEIAPYAAEVDEEARFPVEAQTALTKAGFHAVIVPEEYGGQGPTNSPVASSLRRSRGSARRRR